MKYIFLLLPLIVFADPIGYKTHAKFKNLTYKNNVGKELWIPDKKAEEEGLTIVDIFQISPCASSKKSSVITFDGGFSGDPEFHITTLPKDKLSIQGDTLKILDPCSINIIQRTNMNFKTMANLRFINDQWKKIETPFHWIDQSATAVADFELWAEVDKKVKSGRLIKKGEKIRLIHATKKKGAEEIPILILTEDHILGWAFILSPSCFETKSKMIDEVCFQGD